MWPESAVFNENKQVFRANPFSRKRFRDIFCKYCHKSAYHVYIQGCKTKKIEAGKCALGIKELLNQLFLKMVDGKHFGIIKIFVRITQ